VVGKPLKQRLRCGAVLVGLVMSGAAAAAVEGTATLTSDYVWRGSSQSDGDPAVQAGVKVSAANGWYASAWGSGVSFTPDNGARSEFDLVAGWSGAVAPDWSVDVNLTRYLYPSTTVDLDWTELNGTVTWRQRAWLQVGVRQRAGRRPRRHLCAARCASAAGRAVACRGRGRPLLAGQRAGR